MLISKTDPFLTTCAGGIPSDKSRQDQQVLTYEIMPPLTVFFVGIRFFTRWLFWGGIGADDWMILAAELCYLLEVAFALGMAIFGFGEHTWFLTTDEIINAQRVGSPSALQCHVCKKEANPESTVLLYELDLLHLCLYFPKTFNPIILQTRFSTRFISEGMPRSRGFRHID